jgi:hypothetical protein
MLKPFSGRIVFLLTLVTVIACEDKPTNPSEPEPDAAAIVLRDAQPLEDMELDHEVFEWDATPLDAEVAVTDPGPPIVCPTAGIIDSCQIPGLLGPCAYGQKICMVSEWSDCRQVVNPRRELCNRIDDDCDGHFNEAPETSQNNTLSQPCYSGPPDTLKIGICHGGLSLCEEHEDFGWGFYQCREQRPPAEERCNNLDDDCDDAIDEGVLNDCGVCGDVPEEVCDNEDNDCDGLTDEGVLNACSQCGEVPEELCDHEDNDCDGETDEGLGNCECGNPTYVPQPEVCNGLDEDCDDLIDEGPAGGPLTMLCATDVRTREINTFERREDGPQYQGNTCRVGLAFCDSHINLNGVFEYGYFECLQEVLPGVERCDQLDNDCDGDIDEGFDQGTVAVMIIVDVSGSMDLDELEQAFTATRNTVERLFNAGAMDVCYLLAVVGNDDMPDPYLFAPAHDCVPGVNDVTDIDMTSAVTELMAGVGNGSINRGGATEYTFDALGKFFTDDLLDRDQDGHPDNEFWNTNDPANLIRSIDLSHINHRIAVVLGDEPGQGAHWNEPSVAEAMRQSGSMVFILGPNPAGNPDVMASYSDLIDNGAEYRMGLGNRRAGLRNEEVIVETIEDAIEEAACIQAQEEEEENEQAMMINVSRYVYASARYFHAYDYVLGLCY